MFNWLKKKVQEKSDQEFKNGIKRVEKFLKFAQSKSADKSDQLRQDIESLQATIAIINMGGNTPENMDRLLNVDMICRRIFETEYGGKAFDFNKKFSPK